jgi:hypothetical protein
MLVSQVELTRVREVENSEVPEFVWEDAKGVIRKVATLMGELVKAC